jgi:hypothetical protein
MPADSPGASAAGSRDDDLVLAPTELRKRQSTETSTSSPMS